MAKICPECGYDKNQDFARRCGNCAYAFEGANTNLAPGQSGTLDLQGRNIGADMLTMYDAMYRAAEDFEKHNLSWHVGGKHVRAYELKRKIRGLQSRIEDEAIGAYHTLVAAQIGERVEIQSCSIS